MTKMNDLEELIDALETGKPAYDGEDVNYDVATISGAVFYLKQLQEIKGYLELSLNNSDKFKRKYDEIAEHTHNYNDVYKAKVFEGMAGAYSDILERYFIR